MSTDDTSPADAGPVVQRGVRQHCNRSKEKHGTPKHHYDDRKPRHQAWRLDQHDGTRHTLVAPPVVPPAAAGRTAAHHQAPSFASDWRHAAFVMPNLLLSDKTPDNT